MRRWVALAILLLLSAAPSAQQALDRKKIPTPGKTPELRVPAWTKSTLANGAELLVSEKHDLPLISFSITFVGGADQFEPAGKQSVDNASASRVFVPSLRRAAVREATLCLPAGSN